MGKERDIVETSDSAALEPGSPSNDRAVVRDRRDGCRVRTFVEPQPRTDRGRRHAGADADHTGGTAGAVFALRSGRRHASRSRTTPRR